jgi:RNA polymerase sigma-70 factor (ECF subfamily)
VSLIIVAATSKDSRRDGDAPTPERLDFDSVYTRHFEFACRSLRLLGVEPSALEDSAQDVFGIVSRRLAEFERNANVKTWIFAIVQRVAANHRRSRRRKREPFEPLDEGTLTTNIGPDAHANAARAAAVIQRFAAGLDEPRRALLVLGLFERLPARELSESLGIPLFTVYSRIRSLRESLEKFLKEHEVGA